MLKSTSATTMCCSGLWCRHPSPDGLGATEIVRRGECCVEGCRCGSVWVGVGLRRPNVVCPLRFTHGRISSASVPLLLDGFHRHVYMEGVRVPPCVDDRCRLQGSPIPSPQRHDRGVGGLRRRGSGGPGRPRGCAAKWSFMFSPAVGPRPSLGVGGGDGAGGCG